MANQISQRALPVASVLNPGLIVLTECDAYALRDVRLRHFQPSLASDGAPEGAIAGVDSSFIVPQPQADGGTEAR